MSELMTAGVGLALYGLGTVFVFLTLLVGAMVLMSALVGKFEPETVPPPVSEDEPAMAGAAAAAVRAYRQNHGE